MADNIIIKELQVLFISKKVDNYDNMVSYFKITDPNISKQSRIVNKTPDRIYKPFWKTDKGETMLKVKTKYVPRDDLESKSSYECDLELVAYYVEKTANELKGYYAKMKNIKDEENE